MNQLKNRVQLIGHVGKDPEVRQLSGDRTVAQFSLATSERYKNQQGETVSETQWHQVVVWGKLADIAARYLQKGMQVAVEGKIIYRAYEDKQAVKRYITEIVASDLLMLGKKQEEATVAKKAAAQTVMLDELPF